MRKIFEYGGIAASVILIAFGAGSIAIGFNGRTEVRDSLKLEKIVGTPDMTPALIAKSAQEAKLPASIDLPTCDVADKPIDTGARAKCFAQYMRIHALESTGGRPYAEMGRFLKKDGSETSDPTLAASDPKTGRPVENAARNIWVTETALSTALNTSFFAEQVALFSMVMGLALLLTGIGFLVLSLGGARRTAEGRERSPAPSATIPAH